jgi:rsbT co-antagonist protein RsbR
LAFRRWLSNIPLDDPLEQRQAGLFQILLLIILGGCLIGLPLSLLTNRQNGPGIALVSYPLLILCVTSAVLLLRRGRFRTAVNLATIGIILGIGFALIAAGFRNSSNTLLALAVPITLAGLITSRRGLLLAVGASIGVVVLAGVLQSVAPSLVGFVPGTPASAATIIPSFTLVVGVLTLLLDRFGNTLREALTTTQSREQELERLRASLEITVAERTASLQQALRDVEQREARLAAALDELSVSQTAVRELSAPVIPVLPGVMIAPLIGTLDGDRATLLADNVLGMVERERARKVIFDITGVPLVDTRVAQVLLQTAAAVRLLGAQPLLVGIRPEVAQTIISLGLDFETITTYSNLQEAVEALLPERAGLSVN